MEANLTGSPIDASYNDDAALAEVVNANELIKMIEKFIVLAIHCYNNYITMILKRKIDDWGFGR